MIFNSINSSVFFGFAIGTVTLFDDCENTYTKVPLLSIKSFSLFNMMPLMIQPFLEISIIISVT